MSCELVAEKDRALALKGQLRDKIIGYQVFSYYMIKSLISDEKAACHGNNAG